MKSRFLLTTLVLCSISMMASDSCKVTVHVKAPPVSFSLDNNGNKPAPEITVTPGQPFQISVGYQDGKAPYTCTIANAPTGWTAAATTPGFCDVKGNAPDAEGDYSADLTVTDANGTSATVALGPKPPAKSVQN